MDPVFEFPIALPARDSRGLLRALHGQLRAAILDGRLKPGLA
jgi:GntR family transcriptional regulator/MocR family aminotransferase